MKPLNIVIQGQFHVTLITFYCKIVKKDEKFYHNGESENFLLYTECLSFLPMMTKTGDKGKLFPSNDKQLVRNGRIKILLLV
jgi:hypothetical protein